MTNKIQHRGPDSYGNYLDHGIGLGIRRLSIIDIEGGDQPILNESGTIIVVYNGEIYNFGELRHELENLGHVFQTNSDTEVIVHAYEQWADDCLLKFNGMFVFSLWDANQKRLLIARDRMGQKPLYWHYGPNGLVWASEAKALLTVPWIEARINKLALHHYLTLQYTPDPLTIYDGINQLPAAHKLVLEKDKEPVITRWWQLAFEPKWEITEDEAIEHTRSLLRSAVDRHMISEVPLGAFLSGGIDSSIIAGLMAELSPFPVKTFSIGFTEKHYSEAQYAREVAEFFGTEHHEFIFSPSDLVSLIEDVVASFDEPFADPAALPLFELARQTRQHVTVALSGDGGDETMAGYARYTLDKYISPYSRFPKWITQAAVPAVISIFPEPAWLPEDRNPITGMKRLAQVASISDKASILRWGSYFNHSEKMALYNQSWQDELAGIYSEDIIVEAFDAAIAQNQLDRTLSADQSTYLPGDLLPKTDRMSMAHSLESRAPFLDSEWLEWTARLPAHFKLRRTKSKWLLRNTYKNQLPRGIGERGKQGFSLPIGEWFRKELKSWSHERLLDDQRLFDIFNKDNVEKMLTDHGSGKSNHGKKIWSILMFSIWQRKYVNE